MPNQEAVISLHASQPGATAFKKNQAIKKRSDNFGGQIKKAFPSKPLAASVFPTSSAKNSLKNAKLSKNRRQQKLSRTFSIAEMDIEGKKSPSSGISMPVQRLLDTSNSLLKPSSSENSRISPPLTKPSDSDRQASEDES